MATDDPFSLPPFDPSSLEQVEIRGRRELGSSLAEINYAIASWMNDPYAGAASVVGSGGSGGGSSPSAPLEPLEPLPEVVVVAPRPTPRPAPTPPPAFSPVIPTMEPIYAGSLPFAAAPAPRPAPKRRAPVRRSKPKPQPSRRPRPTTRPLPRGPRIPIPLPPLARLALGRVLGVAALVFPFLRKAAQLDADATATWEDRLGLIPFERRDRDQRLGDPDARAARDRAIAPGYAGSPDAGALETVVVTGRAPRALPSPAIPLFPVAMPGVAFDPYPFAGAAPQPVADPRPVPVPVNAPRPFAPPIPEPFPSPFASPLPLPQPLPRPRPQPAPTLNPLPSALPIPGILALPEALPTPQEALDPCDCKKGSSKKKKKKKDRTLCWGGTYVERSKSLSKRRRYPVDCKTGKKISAANQPF